MQRTIKDLLIYTPAKNFEESKRFYTALGFELTPGWGGAADFRLGGSAFRLQNYYVKDWAENFMMKFDVDDLNGWFEFAKDVIENGNFDGVKISEPEMAGDSPIFHIWDPSGVLLIFVG